MVHNPVNNNNTNSVLDGMRYTPISNDNSYVKGNGLNYFQKSHQGLNNFGNSINQSTPTMTMIANTYIVNGNAVMAPHFG